MATVRQLLDEKGHNVITVGADDTVFDAVRKMAEENIGSLIVCEGSKVIGIITERHYTRHVFLEGRVPSGRSPQAKSKRTGARGLSAQGTHIATKIGMPTEARG